MLNIVIGQNKSEYHIIEKEIAEIREEFNSYYYNEKFNEGLKVLQQYDNESVDDTIRIYVKILKAKIYYIRGDIEDALSIVDTIKQLTLSPDQGIKFYSRVVRHPLLPDVMGKMNCDVHLHKSNNFCLCHYLDERENLEMLTDESLSQYFMDVYVVIKDNSNNDYKEMISKSQAENNKKVKEDGKKNVFYELEPPPDEVFKSLKNKRYDFKSFNEVSDYENDRAKINRIKKLGTIKEKLSFTELLPEKESHFALKLKYLPRIQAKKAIYKLLIDKKYKYTFKTDTRMRQHPYIYIYWDDDWKLAEYKDDERIIFYFPDTYIKKPTGKAFKFDSDYVEDLYIQEYDDETWGLEDYDRYSYGPPNNLILQHLLINEDNLNQKSIEIELTNEYDQYDDEAGRRKFSRKFLYGCIFTSIIVMSSL